ncbi:uncharacterized protein BCR38DRAFT_412597 [Pseudomassariella vexata]|uniref:Uncharacterized protein n=1 Tax=Pseudomassariella vexata TaxID=1141098 RepID=A0A1Y2DK24_9PEZI|nr:uncharacterized protein BCR38DRAFT_412597 [Pseudomassariella vexata]ORY59590.1 hypothetical protein BCR38DRAFT_412597 [Pseudomassariella vexata]
MYGPSNCEGVDAQSSLVPQKRPTDKPGGSIGTKKRSKRVSFNEQPAILGSSVTHVLNPQYLTSMDVPYRSQEDTEKIDCEYKALSPDENGDYTGEEATPDPRINPNNAIIDTAIWENMGGLPQDLMAQNLEGHGLPNAASRGESYDGPVKENSAHNGLYVDVGRDVTRASPMELNEDFDPAFADKYQEIRDASPLNTNQLELDLSDSKGKEVVRAAPEDSNNESIGLAVSKDKQAVRATPMKLNHAKTNISSAEFKKILRATSKNAKNLDLDAANLQARLDQASTVQTVPMGEYQETVIRLKRELNRLKKLVLVQDEAKPHTEEVKLVIRLNEMLVEENHELAEAVQYLTEEVDNLSREAQSLVNQNQNLQMHMPFNDPFNPHSLFEASVEPNSNGSQDYQRLLNEKKSLARKNRVLSEKLAASGRRNEEIIAQCRKAAQRSGPSRSKDLLSKIDGKTDARTGNKNSNTTGDKASNTTGNQTRNRTETKPCNETDFVDPFEEDKLTAKKLFTDLRDQISAFAKQHFSGKPAVKMIRKAQHDLFYRTSKDFEADIINVEFKQYMFESAIWFKLLETFLQRPYAMYSPRARAANEQIRLRVNKRDDSELIADYHYWRALTGEFLSRVYKDEEHYRVGGNPRVKLIEDMSHNCVRFSSNGDEAELNAGFEAIIAKALELAKCVTEGRAWFKFDMWGGAQPDLDKTYGFPIDEEIMTREKEDDVFGLTTEWREDQEVEGVYILASPALCMYGDCNLENYDTYEILEKARVIY